MGRFVEGTPNIVVFLTVDCLRVDTARERINIGDSSDSTVRVTDCYCTGSGTPTSMPGLMQSRLPTDHGGVAKSHPLVDDVPTLAEVMAEEGFECGGWHSNVYTSRHYGYERGFDEFVDLTGDSQSSQSPSEGLDTSLMGSVSLRDVGRRVSEHLGVENTAERAFSQLKRLGLVNSRPHSEASEVVDSVLSWLPDENQSGNYFAWGHFMDLHSPYLPPERFRKQVDGCPTNTREIWRLNDKLRLNPAGLSNDEVRSLKTLYNANAGYVDEQLDRLVAELKDRSLWEDSLIVVTSDHGELFGDTEVPDDLPLEHPNYLTDYVTKVPLLFTGGVTSGRELTELTSGADVAPTILASVGGRVPREWNGVVIGEDEHEEGRQVYSVTGRGTRQDKIESDLIPSDVLHASIRTPENAVLWWSSGGHGPEFYERTRSRDTPWESLCPENEVESSTQLVSKIQEKFSGDAQELDDDQSDINRLTEDATDRLRELGYLE